MGGVLQGAVGSCRVLQGAPLARGAPARGSGAGRCGGEVEGVPQRGGCEWEARVGRSVWGFFRSSAAGGGGTERSGLRWHLMTRG